MQKLHSVRNTSYFDVKLKGSLTYDKRRLHPKRSLETVIVGYHEAFTNRALEDAYKAVRRA